MKDNIEERSVKLADYIIQNNATVRAAAKKHGISKSTVYTDVTDRLQHINKSLYAQVKEVLRENKDVRHIRGGLATREKYRRQSANGRT